VTAVAVVKGSIAAASTLTLGERNAEYYDLDKNKKTAIVIGASTAASLPGATNVAG